MSNKMLIDATHPEETRVVVLRGNRVEEFDFEAADRQPLRGNIYLAKVTRVEPSLQAAFVDYGGNRHGFLAFSEIHPDYYQIPFADRQALLQEQARADLEQAADDDEQANRRADREAQREAEEAEEEQRDSEDAEGEGRESEDSEDAAHAESDAAAPDRVDAESPEGEAEVAEPEEEAEFAPADAPEIMAADVAPTAEVSEPANAEEGEETVSEAGPAAEDAEAAEAEHGHEHEHEHEEDEKVESVGAEDALEELPERRKPRPRQYKIQEVIKRRQVLLVQVVKEERGNKGAALTTYLSLAGRYSVLMPNTARGGGISRKVTTPADRKRMKAIASDLEVPEGMGVILRTAGANRTKSEIKRDFEYLLRLWENVRELTLRSSAPKLVYEEGNLIKRSIRDLYSREIDQVVVAGDDGYREAKDFMRMLMPSHARNVQLYKESVPIFARAGVEPQLDAMFSAQVTLKSGGYIVINQTEALVSIDVNSGRSTREHSIEDTALKTNLEASEEISRQLRLRDLAGLIVIDFIDMEEKRNNRSVERKLKDCLRADRARIQVGRISHFGLMEMSRQRIRTGVLESSTVPCPHCHGTGQVRSVSSLSLQILRALEDHLLRHSGHNLIVRTREEVALYVLNQKRRHLSDLETRFGVQIAISGEAPENGAGYTIERGAPVEDRPETTGAVAMRDMPEVAPPAEEDEVEDDTEREVEESGGESRERRPRRRRRGRRANGDDRHQEHRHADAEVGEGDSDGDSDGEEAPERAASDGDTETAEGRERRRRRGRRGGRRRGRGRENGERVENGHRDEEPAAALEGARSEDEMSAPAAEEPESGPYAEAPAVEVELHADYASAVGAEPRADYQTPGRPFEPEPDEETAAPEPSAEPEPVAAAEPTPSRGQPSQAQRLVEQALVVLLICKKPASGGLLHYGKSGSCRRPVVSSRPKEMFMFCSAWPAEPLTRLSSTEITMARPGMRSAKTPTCT